MPRSYHMFADVVADASTAAPDNMLAAAPDSVADGASAPTAGASRAPSAADEATPPSSSARPHPAALSAPASGPALVPRRSATSGKPSSGKPSAKISKGVKKRYPPTKSMRPSKMPAKLCILTKAMAPASAAK